MSFGWSVGDIFTAIEIIYEVSEALKSSTGSPEDQKRANQFLGTLNHTITVVQQIYGPNLPQTPGSGRQNEDSNVPPPTKEELECLDSLKELYDRFKDEVANYDGMNKLPNEKERRFLHRQAQKISWHFFAKKQITDLRDKITAQVNLLQPALTARQFQGISIQASNYHEESLANFDDLKTMIRVLYSHVTANYPSRSMPEPDPTVTLSRASTLLAGDPGDYTGYTTARQQLVPFISPSMPDQISQSLKRLRGAHKLRVTLKTWLTNLDSASTPSNILWLLDNPVATQVSALLFNTLTSLDRPVLAFSCSHVDPKSKDIVPDTLLRNTVYSFLHTLLTYLDTHLPDVRQRIDASSFTNLDGSTASIPTAITLLGNLLDNLPSPCICIIDNVQYLDKPAIKPHLLELFALFGRRPNRAFATFEGSHKLLLTTKGPCAVLSDMSLEKRLTRLATKDQVVQSGGYILWEEMKSTIEGMKVAEEGVDMIAKGETGNGL